VEKMGFGLKLERLLEIRGRNVNDLALALNKTPSTIYAIIRRNSNSVDLDLVFAIAKELGVKVDYFTDRERSENDEDNIFYNASFEKELDIMKERPGLQALVLSSGDISDDEIEQAFKVIAALKK
jgi:transcriptional regulator with XRE-family HTH domain